MSAPFRIRRQQTQVGLVASGNDDEKFKFYLDRLMKMIPGEVVGLYLAGIGFIPATVPVALVVWSVVCLLGVVAIKAYGTADPKTRQPPDWVHVGISSAAFVIWVYASGGPFAAFGIAVPWIGSLLVLAWTFFIPIFYQGPEQ